MSQVGYSNPIGGQGKAEGLPVRHGSHLYDVEPDIRYPNVLDLGTTQASQFQYAEETYLRPPHLPITFVVEPYIDNHKTNGGNLTRKQYYVLNRGQAVMASTKRDQVVSVFADGTTTDDDGNVVASDDRTYADPAEVGGRGRIVGFDRADTYKRVSTNTVSADADLVISKTHYDDELGSDEQDDYEEVTEDNSLSHEDFLKLPEDEQFDFFPVYGGLGDENDEIPSGGVNRFAQVEEALFGNTDKSESVELDAESFYFGDLRKVDGFMFPSSGGAKRTIFFNETDQEAGVTLPADADRVGTDIVRAIGNVTDVSADSVGKFKNSAVVLDAKPTVGVTHTDLEQTKNYQHYHFQTGTEDRSPVRSGVLKVPYIAIDELETLITEKTTLSFGGDPTSTDTFNFVNQKGQRSGIKTGLYNTEDITAVNYASLLTGRDAGYANLHYGFAAPFLVTKSRPEPYRDSVKPDLRGYFTTDDAGFLASGTADADLSAKFDSATAAENEHGKVDMRAMGLDHHVMGKIVNREDMPGSTLEQLRVNPIFQTRIVGDKDRNAMNEGHRRLGGTADTGGLKQITSDFILMMLGGSNFDHFSQFLPTYDGKGQDLSQVLRDMVLDGVAGTVTINFDVGT